MNKEDDMKLTDKEIIQLIEMEIEWCNKHADPGNTREFESGFIAGLHQVKYIIETVNKHGATPRQMQTQ